MKGHEASKPEKQALDVKTLRKRAISAAYHSSYAAIFQKTGNAELAKEEARKAYATAAAKFDDEHKPHD